MKKVFLITVFALLSFNAFSQEKFTTEDLIGYWEPDQHATQLVIWKDVNNNFQMVEFSTISGTPLTLLSMKLKENNLVVKTRFDEKNWAVECSFTFINKNTLQCTVKGPINGTVIYTKIK
jgi:hypothetical protein